MSLNGIVNNALTGLQASQIGMRTTSSNVSNANTPGYARTEILQAPRSSAGQGMGVEVTGVRRVADAFLQAASLRAASDAERADAVFALLDRLQSQFGSTDDDGSLFGRLNQAFSSIASAALDPSEQVSRQAALSDLELFFSEAQRLSTEVRGMRDEADQRIGDGVTRINEILAELEDLNGQVQSLSANASDATGAANRQSVLLDELSGLIDVRVEKQGDGRIFVRTGDGVALLDNSRLELEYTPSGTGAYGVDYGRITAEVSSSGATIDVTSNVRSGELRGLMDLRDNELPALAAQLSELAAGSADALNAAHNDSSAVPAPSTLEGRNTGLLATDVLNGSGQATLAVTAPDGALVNRVDIAFTGAGFTVDGNAGTSIGDLVTELNNAFGGDATASFTDGRLTITAAGGNGVAALNDPADPSSLGGRGFAHFFGLNDVVESPRPGFFETALTATSAHGLTPGGELGFKVTAPDGREVADITVGVAGATIQDQIDALNDPTTGLGQYGSFALDGDGELSFTPSGAYADFEVSLSSDTTERGSTGLAFSQIFGLGDAARLVRAESFEVSPELRADPSKLALAKLDIDGTTVAGDLVLAKGDARGGQALQEALTARREFSAAGGLSGGLSSLEEYAARLAGDVGARAARAERANDAAQSVREAADQKRADVEGVNLDEELAQMTLYQQAYNASARMLQAAREMTDTLLNLV